MPDNNPLERIIREIRRRTRVVGAFPDGQSCLNLAAARLRYIAGSAWSVKRYMNMRPLYEIQFSQTGAVASSNVRKNLDANRHDTRSDLLHAAALPLGSLTPADAPPIEAEILFR